MGMGVESTAILLRWLEDDTSRDFALADLVVMTAMTGDEFARTATLMEAHVLPRMADAGVRYVQVARAGLLASAGVVILDDSRSPQSLHADGCFKLSDELTMAGTTPQIASGRRLCSCRAKGEPLDAVIDAVVGDRPYRHAIGFNATETGRAERDTSYTSHTREAWYPLIEWGWSRARCSDYLASVTGVTDWPKSACVFCPFSANRGSLATHLARYREEPQAAKSALRLEHTARALNPNMLLYGTRSVAQLLAADGNDTVLVESARELAALPHALYRVRRLLLARRGEATKKGTAWRSVEVMSTGTASECRAELSVLSATEGLEVTEDAGIARVWVRRRGVGFPTAEEFYVVAPAGVAAKQRVGFDARWAQVTGEGTLFDLREPIRVCEPAHPPAAR